MTLNQFFYLSSVNGILETCTKVWIEQLKELKLFRGTFTRWYLKKWALSQKSKTLCSLKTTTWGHTIFIWLSSTMKQILEMFNYELLHSSNFSCTLNKKASSCRQNIVKFRHNIPYMVNSFVFSLNIPVMVNNWYWNDQNFVQENAMLYICIDTIAIY